MKGFYWGTGRIRCSFCGGFGHNITTCHGVDTFGNLALDKLSKIPNYECTNTEKRALHELKRREERKIKMRNSKRNTRKCSFCRSTTHTRNKCKDLVEFKKLLYKANKNWKKTLTEAVNEHGLGVGALIQLTDHGNNSVLAMITDINLRDLNVFCGFNGENKYRSNTNIEIAVGADLQMINFKSLHKLIKNDLFIDDYWFTFFEDPKVINPMGWNPDQEWLNSEWDEVFNWFFNDVSLLKIQSNGVMDYLNKWANKN